MSLYNLRNEFDALDIGEPFIVITGALEYFGLELAINKGCCSNNKWSHHVGSDEYTFEVKGKDKDFPHMFKVLKTLDEIRVALDAVRLLLMVMKQERDIE